MGFISEQVRDYADSVVDDWTKNIGEAAIDELLWLRGLAERVGKMAVTELERRGAKGKP